MDLVREGNCSWQFAPYAGVAPLEYEINGHPLISMKKLPNLLEFKKSASIRYQPYILKVAALDFTIYAELNVQLLI